ncbi:hypothetical protein J6590_029321 [Homalodisca vitripennis]|nr:hypothetical protein J6590_029321 [Homalodisca vitripennis]
MSNYYNVFIIHSVPQFLSLSSTITADSTRLQIQFEGERFNSPNHTPQDTLCNTGLMNRKVVVHQSSDFSTLPLFSLQ